MDPQFWLLKWQNSETGFHEDDVNPNLKAHFPRLDLTEQCRVFVPLCGKSIDISWLLGNGLEVIGAELSELAVEQLFQQLDEVPEITKTKTHRVYRAEGLTVFCGNIFDLTEKEVGQIDAIWDRAALVALPFETRRRYTSHLQAISGFAKQLLVTFDYDQSLMDGPPFSVINSEVEQHYLNTYDITLLDSTALRLKDKVNAEENVWLLTSSN